MSVPLLKILDRLKQENLHGPTLPFSNINKPSSSFGQWNAIGNEYTDLDSKDPRWFDLFKEFFIDSSHEVHDDILFFVRQYVESSEVDPVFVKRRVPNMIPTLTDLVDWKMSFFLNLICQLPCTLTVAVCTRGTIETSTKPTTSSTTSTDNNHPPANVTSQEGNEGLDSKVHDGNALKSQQQQSSSSATPGTSKPPMIAKKRITKKVFAAPYKSRMDVKDAFMNECSFPFVYYTVNDYDSQALHLRISEKEYMCVELSLTCPLNPATHPYADSTAAAAAISVEKDPSPFPVPDGHAKIVLFQGAVGYSSLLDIYQEKGLAAQNQIRNGWSRFGSKSNSAPLSTNDESDMPDISTKRTEYITIRGPSTKGNRQGQIAITSDTGNDPTISSNGSANNIGTDDYSIISPVPDPSNKSTPSFSDRLKSLGSLVKTQLVGPGKNDTPSILIRPNALLCSMTYIAIPWQAIAIDILEYRNNKS